MVRTGARAAELQQLLVRAGRTPARTGPPSPRLDLLRPDLADEILALYRHVGGTEASPRLRPGSWDLVFDDGLIIELDEELHFNRYRDATLAPQWAAELPWTTDYRELCAEHEAECLAAATWGKRWSNPSCENLFGPGDPPGTLGPLGAPRWKQRALYDAMKDAAALGPVDVTLARMSTHDNVDGVSLGAVLRQQAALNLDALIELVARRTL